MLLKELNTLISEEILSKVIGGYSLKSALTYGSIILGTIAVTTTAVLVILRQTGKLVLRGSAQLIPEGREIVPPDRVIPEGYVAVHPDRVIPEGWSAVPPEVVAAYTLIANSAKVPINHDERATDGCKNAVFLQALKVLNNYFGFSGDYNWEKLLGILRETAGHQ